MKKADDVVEAFAVDGQPGVRLPRQEVDHLVERRVGADAAHLGPRHHHLAGGEIAEAEDAVQHLLLVLLEDAGFLARRHEHLELLFRVHHRVTARCAQPEEADRAPAHPVQQRDEGPERDHEHVRSAR